MRHSPNVPLIRIYRNRGLTYSNNRSGRTTTVAKQNKTEKKQIPTWIHDIKVSCEHTMCLTILRILPICTPYSMSSERSSLSKVDASRSTFYTCCNLCCPSLANTLTLSAFRRLPCQEISSIWIGITIFVAAEAVKIFSLHTSHSGSS